MEVEADAGCPHGCPAPSRVLAEGKGVPVGAPVVEKIGGPNAGVPCSAACHQSHAHLVLDCYLLADGIRTVCRQAFDQTFGSGNMHNSVIAVPEVLALYSEIM